MPRPRITNSTRPLRALPGFLCQALKGLTRLYEVFKALEGRPSKKAVFRSRAAELGVDPAAVQVAVDNNIATMGQFGFSSAFIPGPGNQDETPLRELVKTLHSLGDVSAITIAQMTSIRRLYLEAS